MNIGRKRFFGLILICWFFRPKFKQNSWARVPGLIASISSVIKKLAFDGQRFCLKISQNKQYVKTHMKYHVIAFSAEIQRKLSRVKVCSDTYVCNNCLYICNVHPLKCITTYGVMYTDCYFYGTAFCMLQPFFHLTSCLVVRDRQTP